MSHDHRAGAREDALQGLDRLGLLRPIHATFSAVADETSAAIETVDYPSWRRTLRLAGDTGPRRCASHSLSPRGGEPIKPIWRAVLGQSRAGLTRRARLMRALRRPVKDRRVEWQTGRLAVR